MNVNQLLHPVAGPTQQVQVQTQRHAQSQPVTAKVSLPSISDILYELPPAAPAYPPVEQRHYYLGRISPLPPHSMHPIQPMVMMPYVSTPSAVPAPSSATSSSASSISSISSREPYSPNLEQTSPSQPAAIIHKIDSQTSSTPKRKTRNNLPKETTYILLKWLNEHLNHPYPNSFEKNQLMVLTGLNQQQLSNWFINARRRKIKALKRA